MEDPLWSSPPRDGERGDWHTPPRKTVRVLARQGKSDREIVEETSIPRTTVQQIRKQESSRRPHKSKGFHQRMMTIREIQRAIRFISKDYTSRYMTYERVRALLGIKASARTIRRELHRAGYRRCIACPRPFISWAQAKQRLLFARAHRWWGTSDYAATQEGGGDWRKVIWSDECTWEIGRKGRAWIIRRTDEKRCPTCIRSVYRSGRFTVMIWGAIGWDYKSPLVFLEKLPDRKGVCSKAYLEQVLEPIIFPLFDSLGPEYIFMEDGSKVHKGKARLPRLQHGIHGFNWPPSSPDLNPIERVWRYMKEELKKLPYVITTKAELMREIQRIWDEINV